LVDLSIGAGQLTFLVDTGSDGGLTLHPEDLARLGHIASPTDVQRHVLVASASGRHEASVLEVAALLHMGDDGPKPVTLHASDVMTPGLGLAGNGFLDDYVVTIDWPARMLYLQPVGGPTVVDSPSLRSASSADRPARSRR
jgi:hypothetical protein